MLQVASFPLPQGQDEANKFLATHKPAGQVHFNRDMIVVFYEDGVYAPEAKIADLRELLESAEVAKTQQEIVLHMLKTEQADLKPTSGRYNELDDAIINTKRAIDTQDLKMAYVRGRIADLEATLPQKNG
jgi:hypothetical protein